MKLWNGYRWTEYTGEPLQGAVISARSIEPTLDPSVQVVTEDHAMAEVEAAHERFRRAQVVTPAEGVPSFEYKAADGTRRELVEGVIVDMLTAERDRPPSPQVFDPGAMAPAADDES